MSEEIFALEARITFTNPAQRSEAHDTVSQQIAALSDADLDNLSCVLDTDRSCDTLRALYRWVPQLANDAINGQKLDERMLEVYRIAVVARRLRDRDAPCPSFRDWCLAHALGPDTNATVDYALQLLERVRPPQTAWSDWLEKLTGKADLHDDVMEGEDFAHETTPVSTPRPDTAGVAADTEQTSSEK